MNMGRFLDVDWLRSESDRRFHAADRERMAPAPCLAASAAGLLRLRCVDTVQPDALGTKP